MNKEYCYDISTSYEKINFLTVPDPETGYILATDSHSLLEHLFRDSPNYIFLLRGSGFNMDMQVENWKNGVQTNIDSGNDFEQFRLRFIQQTITDVVGYYYEYLTGQDVFPIEVERKKDPEGNTIVYARNYQKSLEEVTLTEERDGALAQGVKKAIEIIIDSGPNTVILLNSPKGWSGMKQDENEIVYPDNQTYVYWINDSGNLEAITIRTDIGLDIAERLVGSTSTENDSHLRIKNVVSNPISFQAQSIEEALDLIEKVSGQRFTKQRRELKKRHDLFKLNTVAAKIISDLKDYLVENVTDLSFNNIKTYVTKVGKSILDLAQQTIYPKPTIVYSGIKSRSNNIVPTQKPNYYELAKKLTMLSGCNGGGNTTFTSNESDYYSTTTSFFGYESGDGLGPSEFVCPACGFVNSRPYGGFVSVCQNPNCTNPSAVVC